MTTPSPSPAPRSWRRTCLKIALFLALGLIIICLASAAAVYATLPYDAPRDIAQIVSEMIRQRLSPGNPEPATFPPNLTRDAANLGEQAEMNRLMADVAWLSADERQGRQAGTPSEDEVGAWLIERFQTLGLRPFEEAGLTEFAQPFQSADSGQAENIIGVLPGSEPADTKTGRFLIVGAHYDHLGVGEDGQVYNGADDNATGTAAVLEIARLFTLTRQPPKETVIFVLFSGEEGGRRGSSAFGRLLQSKGLAGRCQMLNLEVLGAVAGKGTYLDVWDQEARSAAYLADAVQEAGDWLDIEVVRQGRDPGSDAQRLLAYGIPAVTIDTAWSDENHPYDHTPQDDVSVIDITGLLRGARVAAASAWLLANDGR